MHDLPIQERLSKFLLTYCLTPHSTTGIAPAELLMGHIPSSFLDNLLPDLSLKVGNRQAKQKLSHTTLNQLALLYLKKLSLQRTSQECLLNGYLVQWQK